MGTKQINCFLIKAHLILSSHKCLSKDKLLILERVVLLLPLDTTDNENENGMAGGTTLTDKQGCH